MLKLNDIVKEYRVGNNSVHALKGVSLSFAKTEFVSVVGPSGCGKTTLLNIIGGLDKYTSGDLFINDVSTKHYKDADWDAYRNRSIGFVFQSYNLIPHQSVLANVELALTLSGIGKSERRERAMRALIRVGLEEQASKRPNQLSGGQMQRVSIARALVNNPDIILADEPTGALDSVTSVQIMELLKEISGEKLIIMVTHNLELANKYSDRIIRLLDGEVESESVLKEKAEEKVVEEGKQSVVINAVGDVSQVNIFQGDVANTNISQENAARGKKRKKHTSMSFKTALALSGRNLLTKKGRTFLTAFAGSIGIIGIALVMSLSTGFQSYIDQTQNEMMATMPIQISKVSYDISGFSLGGGSGNVSTPLADGDIRVDSSSMSSLVHVNNITDKYIEYIEGLDSKNYNAMFYGYGHGYQKRLLSKNGNRVELINDRQSSGSGVTGTRAGFTALAGDNAFLDLQLELVAGEYPTEYTGLLLVVDSNRNIDKEVLAQLNMDSQSGDFQAENFLDREFKLVNNNQFYVYNDAKGYYDPIASTQQYEDVYGDANNFTMKIVGVARARGGMLATFSEGLAYHRDLPKKFIEKNFDSDVCNAQRGNDKYSVISGNSLTADILSMFSDSGFSIDEVLNMINSATGQTFTEEELIVFVDGILATPNLDAAIDAMFADAPEEVKVMLPTIKGLILQFKTLRATQQTAVLQGIGGTYLPSSIDIYPKDYNTKVAITSYLDKWNDNKDSADQIMYTDMVEMVGEVLGTIVNSISIVLIVFASISLVVSSIMIAIITYVSVIERTKEIGVLRSLGARKKDVSRVFNAETVTIGAIAGLMGVFIAWLGTFVINAIVGVFVDLGASLSVMAWWHVLIMIALSIGLTLMSGFIPSRIAAKKDPVRALRTE